MNHAMRCSGVVDSGAADRAPERAQERDDLTPEVHDDRNEGSEVEGDVERLVERVVLLEEVPVGEPRQEDEVARGGDRQELGETLRHAEGQRLPVGERAGSLAHAERSQNDRDEERRDRQSDDRGAAHPRRLS